MTSSTSGFLAALGVASVNPVAPVGAAAVVIVAVAYLAIISAALTWIDATTHRLPNAIVLPGYAIAGALFTLAAWLGGDWASLLRAGVGMVVLYAFYFVLRLARRTGMGGGDVKLAGLIGMALGWVGWEALAVGAIAAFVLGGVFGMVLLITRRARASTAIPFGPWMILGAWIGAVAGGPLAGGYLGMTGFG